MSATLPAALLVFPELMNLFTFHPLLSEEGFVPVYHSGKKCSQLFGQLQVDKKYKQAQEMWVWGWKKVIPEEILTFRTKHLDKILTEPIEAAKKYWKSY